MPLPPRVRMFALSRNGDSIVECLKSGVLPVELRVFRVRWSILLWSTILLIIGTAVGCGGNLPPRTPVEGTVLYDGEPVAGASVTFTPVDDGPEASAATGPDGRFKLSTYKKGDGAVLGKHRVTVIKAATPREEEKKDKPAPPPAEKPETPDQSGDEAKTDDKPDDAPVAEEPVREVPEKKPTDSFMFTLEVEVHEKMEPLNLEPPTK